MDIETFKGTREGTLSKLEAETPLTPEEVKKRQICCQNFLNGIKITKRRKVTRIKNWTIIRKLRFSKVFLQEEIFPEF